MVAPLLKNLATEKIVMVKTRNSIKLTLPLDRVVRLVDRKGNTLGLIMNQETISEIEEEIEVNNPKFLLSLERSRSSGRLSSAEVKKLAGL